VPPFEAIAFAYLPAQQDNTAVTQRGEVYEAPTEIFQLHSKGFNFAYERCHIDQQRGIGDAVADASTSLLSIFGCLFGFVAVCDDLSVRSLDLSYYVANSRKQGIRFFHAKYLHGSFQSLGKHQLARFFSVLIRHADELDG